MRCFFQKLFFLLSLSLSLEEEPSPAVITVVAQNEQQLQLLRALALDERYDFWSPPEVGTANEVLVARNNTKRFLGILHNLQIPFKVSEENLQQKVEAEMKELKSQKLFTMGMSSKAFALSQYHQYEEMAAFMKTLALSHPSIAALLIIGSSYEGRPLVGIKIGKGGGGVKPSVWIDSGSRPRDWIGPATSLFIINQLVEKYSSDAGIKALVDSVDVYVLPVSNPDGYVYSWSSTLGRFWSKTRSLWSCTPWSCCYGADLYRNWDAEWNTTGVSQNPCSNSYPGPSAFSEPETAAISRQLSTLNQNGSLRAYISLNAYGQKILLPYSYRTSAVPTNYREMYTLAMKSEKTLQNVHNNFYAVLQSAQYAGEISGSPLDWTAGKLDIPFAFNFLLRPTGGFNAYNLPAQQIVPTGEETLEGIKIIANNIQ